METETRFHASQNWKLEAQHLKFTKSSESEPWISKLETQSQKLEIQQSQIEDWIKHSKFEIQNSTFKLENFYLHIQQSSKLKSRTLNCQLQIRKPKLEISNWKRAPATPAPPPPGRPGGAFNLFWKWRMIFMTSSNIIGVCGCEHDSFPACSNLRVSPQNSKLKNSCPTEIQGFTMRP